MMTIKQYLASINTSYAEYRELWNTPVWQWTQGQQLLAKMLYEAMDERLIRRIDAHKRWHKHLYKHDAAYRQECNDIIKNRAEAIAQRLIEEAE